MNDALSGKKYKNFITFFRGLQKRQKTESFQIQPCLSLT